MSKITTESKKVSRTVETDLPVILTVESLEALQEILGEDYEKLVLKSFIDQSTIKLRSKVRNMLEATETLEGSDEEQLKYTDAQILAEDWLNWKPALREAQSNETKLAALAEKVSPEALVSIMAQQLGKSEEEVRASLGL